MSESEDSKVLLENLFDEIDADQDDVLSGQDVKKSIGHLIIRPPRQTMVFVRDFINSHGLYYFKG